MGLFILLEKLVFMSMHFGSVLSPIPSCSTPTLRCGVGAVGALYHLLSKIPECDGGTVLQP